MFFAHLNRAKGCIPLASLSGSRDRSNVFHNGIRQRENLSQLRNNPHFGFPSASRGRGDAVLAVQTIREAFGPSPLAKASCPSHGPSNLDSILDVIGGLNHQIDDSSIASHDAEALKFASRINPYNQRLIVGLLRVTQLNTEQAELVPLWSCFATLEEMAGFGRRAGHLGDASAIDNR